MDKTLKHVREEVARVASLLSGTSAQGESLLDANLRYVAFLEKTRHEGLKGRVKRIIFKTIGFFANWQGQLNVELSRSLAENGALSDSLASRILDLEGRVIELSEMKDALAEHKAFGDSLAVRIADLEERSFVMSKMEDALYEELCKHRLEIARWREKIEAFANRKPSSAN
jgi:uncharacterized coiled-coil protein SlyX